MLKAINTKILLSAVTVLAATALVIGGTFAFFSDTETSRGNVLAAGAIDLKIDNESYVTDPETGKLVFSEGTSWSLRDLTIEKFFDFEDLKPGDIGEDTISIHVDSNDAWLCAAARVTEDSDVDYTEPELEDDTTQNLVNPLLGNGELAENLNFAFWADDGDNVLEDGEEEGIFFEGSISALGERGQIALADFTGNVWGDTGPLPGGSDRFIGKAWCFGTLTPAPLGEDNGTPIERGTGFNCSGAGDANNAAQTDRVMGDLQFYAVQSRNNATFTCERNYTPAWPTPTQAPLPE